MTPLKELSDSFQKGANKLNEMVQLLQLSLDKIQPSVEKVGNSESEDSEILVAQLNSYDDSFCSAQNFIDVCTKKLDTILSVLSPTIRWLPDVQNMMEMFYQEGASPWSFVLRHTTTNSVSSVLVESIKKRILKPLFNVAAGDFICCHEKKSSYRGVVLSLLPNKRVKVLNVDNYHKKIVKTDNIYDLTVDILDIPAQAIQCCLMSLGQDDEKLWSDELNQIFKATLSECKLSVNVVDRVETLPPKFVVEIIAYNDSLESEVNLNEWICHLIIPELKQMEKSDSDNIVYMMREDALDPFYAVAAALNESGDTETNSNAKNSTEEYAELETDECFDKTNKQKNFWPQKNNSK